MPVDRNALVESLQSLLATADVPARAGVAELSERLDQVMSSATHVLQVDGVGLMLLDEHDTLRVAGTTDEASAAIEHGQQHLGLGPGVDCVRTGATVAVDDLAESDTYRALWELLQQGHAVRAVLSVPVRTDGHVLGTLNALRLAPVRWTAEHVRAVEAYAGIVGVLIRLGGHEQRGGFRARPRPEA